MRPLKEAMRTAGCKRCVRAVLELGQGAARERERWTGGTRRWPAKKPAAERVNSTYVMSAAESKATKALKVKYNFAPPPPVLYETLLDTNRIRGATASDASMSTEVVAS